MAVVWDVPHALLYGFSLKTLTSHGRVFYYLFRYMFMSKSIYVGNLPFSATEDEVREMFEAHGEVQSVKLIADRDTGRPRGFGFVEMEQAEAEAAIKALNGVENGGRPLRINMAEEKKPRAGAGGGGRGRW